MGEGLECNVLWIAVLEPRIVRDDQQGCSGFCGLRFQEVNDGLGGVVVEGARGLVCKDHGWPVDERPGDAGALLLADAQIRGSAVGFVADAEGLEHRGSAGAVRLCPGEERRHHQVFHDRQGPDEMRALEDDPDVLPAKAIERSIRQPPDGRTVDAHFTCRRAKQSAEQMQQRSFPRSRGAEEEESVSGLASQIRKPHFLSFRTILECQTACLNHRTQGTKPPARGERAYLCFVNFKQRLIRFAIGIAIGTLLSIWMLGSRGCTEWFPAQRIRTSIRMAGIRTTPELRCALECLANDAGALEVWLMDGRLNWDASGPRETPQRYQFDVSVADFPDLSGLDISTLALTFSLSDTAAVASLPPEVLAACGCEKTGNEGDQGD